MDFGDTISALFIRIIQEKRLAKMCKLDVTRQVILPGAYADNYNSSFRTREKYLNVKQDMEEILEQIGLPLKNTYTTVGTDPGILAKLGKEEEPSLIYNFLGLKWNLLQNTIMPNSYFGLAKKKGGIGTQKIDELDEAELSSSLGVITRRLILVSLPSVMIGLESSCLAWRRDSRF